MYILQNKYSVIHYINKQLTLRKRNSLNHDMFPIESSSPEYDTGI